MLGHPPGISAYQQSKEHAELIESVRALFQSLRMYRTILAIIMRLQSCLKQVGLGTPMQRSTQASWSLLVLHRSPMVVGGFVALPGFPVDPWGHVLAM